jgi:hypothetical protein
LVRCLLTVNVMKNAKTILAVLTLCFATGIAGAKDQKNHGSQGKGKPAKNEVEVKQSKPSEKKDASASVKVAFTSQERDAIKTYVKLCESDSKKGKQLPPGLQKKVDRGGALPPGWQKKLIVGEVMPVDVVKIGSPLPKELSLKLPSQPLGVITIAIDGKIVRLAEKSREILDILEF